MATGISVTELHATAAIETTEGGSCVEQIDYFLNLLRSHTNVKTVLEIGFNAGLSAAAILSSRDDVKLVSIDIGAHPYVLTAKTWIDKTFSGRHTLVIGDSTTALPKLMELFPGFSPDLIFIDGGHDAPVPGIDIDNSLKLARPDTWILVDDVVPWMTGIIEPLNQLIGQHKIHVFDTQRTGIHGWALIKKVM